MLQREVGHVVLHEGKEVIVELGIFDGGIQADERFGELCHMVKVDGPGLGNELPEAFRFHVEEGLGHQRVVAGGDQLVPVAAEEGDKFGGDEDLPMFDAALCCQLEHT